MGFFTNNLSLSTLTVWNRVFILVIYEVFDFLKDSCDIIVKVKLRKR